MLRGTSSPMPCSSMVIFDFLSTQEDDMRAELLERDNWGTVVRAGDVKNEELPQPSRKSVWNKTPNGVS